MSKKRSRERRKNRWVHLVFKTVGSVIMIAVLLYLSTFAFRYCLGLFAEGDYIVMLPGQDSPVVQEKQGTGEDLPEATEPDFVVEIARADILTTGDLMMHLPIVRSGSSGGEYNFDYIFNYVSPYVSQADYAVVNLETTLAGTENGNEYTGYPKFNAPDAIARGAKNGGFDLMLTANNHCNDYGTAGLLRTLEVVKAAGLDTLGTTRSADEQNYLVKEIGGVKVGMINYTFAEIGDDWERPAVNGLPTDRAAAGLINAFDYDQLDMFYEEMANNISAMEASGAEAIVLFIHWGDEYTTKVNDNQKDIAQKMCDLGVDVIAGSHPHVVQTVELLTSTADEKHKTLCMYSMGNFLSNQRAENIGLSTGQSEDSVLFSFTFVKYSNGEVYLEDFSLQPTWVLIRGSGDGRTYHILPLDMQVEDWEDEFDLSSDQVSDAMESYNRTMAIINTGKTEVEAAMTRMKESREGTYAEAGVG